MVLLVCTDVLYVCYTVCVVLLIHCPKFYKRFVQVSNTIEKIT